MLLPEQIQLHLADLANALGDAVAGLPPVPPAPPPPLDDATLKELGARHPDLAKLVTGRTAVLQERAAEAVKAQDALRQVYGDAAARIAAVVKGSGGEPDRTQPPASPRPTLSVRKP
jgi:hypothetical protein